MRKHPSAGAQGEGEAVGVPAPKTVKRALTFHSSPTNILTSYSPGIHASGVQSVKPYPPVEPSHSLLSKQTTSSPRYHKAVQGRPRSRKPKAKIRRAHPHGS